jgi:rhodanese-related sulfurtransferase
MNDGDALEMGNVRLKVLETPGHTPESISILVYDLNRDSEKPEAVLTGDTLFVGDVGRPDLRVALGSSAAELGALLYDSLHQKLLTLPSDTRILPAHGAGSLCGKALGSENSSTIGIQRRLNYALQPMEKEAFIELVLADQPDAPGYFTYDAVLNTKDRITLDKALKHSLKPLGIDDVLRLKEQGAQLLDVRDPNYFAAAHLVGSINIGLGGKYATWAGTILDRERQIVIIAEPGQKHEAETRLGRIGFDNIAGYLDRGMGALDARPDLVRRTDRIDATRLAEELASAQTPVVVDVRGPRERDEKRIEGSLHVPLNHLDEYLEEIPRDRRLVVHCATGYRSSIAASLLRCRRFTDVADLAGGIAAWETVKLPIAEPSR